MYCQNNHPGGVSSLKNGLALLERQVLYNKSENAKKVVFTAVTGGYDHGYPLKIKDPETDYIYFHDGNIRELEGWITIRIPFWYRSDQRTAKLIKILPQYFLSSYSESIWIDGNRIIKSSIWPLLNSLDSDLAMFLHHSRKTLKQEVMECQKWRKDNVKLLAKQYDQYLRLGFDDSVGLFQGSFIYRRHHSERVAILMQSWWNEIDSHSVRDQISLPYCVWKEKVYPSIIKGNPNFNEYFETVFHAMPYVADAGSYARMIAMFSVFVKRVPRLNSILRAIKKIKHKMKFGEKE